MADANKTELTLRVTEAAANWLSGIGAKAIETEVCVDSGWIADLAAFWYPTRTEAQKSHLIPYRPKAKYDYDSHEYRWPKGKSQADADKWEQEYVRIFRMMTIVHEVKTSRGDFKSDDKWVRPPVADLQILSYVKGILKPEELPVGWWHLEHSDSGKLLRASKCPTVHDVTDRQRLNVVSQICERRHNRTHYEFQRSLQQSHRSKDNEYTNRNRLSNSLQVCLSILDGASVEDALTVLGFGRERTSLPDYILKKLNALAERSKALEQRHGGDQGRTEIQRDAHAQSQGEGKLV